MKVFSFTVETTVEYSFQFEAENLDDANMQMATKIRTFVPSVIIQFADGENLEIEDPEEVEEVITDIREYELAEFEEIRNKVMEERNKNKN